MNKTALRCVMLTHGETYQDLARLLKISRQSFANKINEVGTEFKQSEIATISAHYGLTAQEVAEIFFAPSV